MGVAQFHQNTKKHDAGQQTSRIKTNGAGTQCDASKKM
jgi:hypothetical protein